MPIFRSLDLEQMLIYQKICFMKKCYFSLNKLPFDVQATEKNLTCYLIFIVYKVESATALDTLTLMHPTAYL